MLTQKDKAFIKETIQKSIAEALTVRVKMEKRRDLKTGQPLAIPEMVEEDVFLPVFWVQYLPYFEGAIRGVQETADKAKNNSAKCAEAVENMASIMISYENVMKALPVAVGRLVSLADGKPMVKLIEG